MSYSESDTRENQTTSGEFILVGFSYLGELQILLFVLLLLIYLLTLMGNLLVILLVTLNSTLQTPMYFFLVNLSFLEICFTTSVVPQLLVHLLVEEKTIFLQGCIAQMYIYTIMGFTEHCFLVVMAYDRYLAICCPLHYTTIMSGRACAQLMGASWIICISVTIVLTMWLFGLPFCGSHRIHHFFCDIPPMMKKACIDTTKIKIVGSAVSVLFLTIPFLLIILSYVCILCTILKLPSAEGRQKAFSTCSSHLMVVTLFYGMSFFTYLVPKSEYAMESDQMISLINTIVGPVLNPLIYTLRNKEVNGALRKTVGKSIFAYSWRS